MVTFLSILHVFVAVILIVVVLLQDSKGAGIGGAFGSGGNANSVLGATGAANLLVKVTRAAVVIFAFTAVGLTNFYTQSTESALDKAGLTPTEKEAPKQMANPPSATGAANSAAPTPSQASGPATNGGNATPDSSKTSSEKK